jgi:hypothetical protein
MTIALQNQFYKTFKEQSLFHRYISFKQISPLLIKHESHFGIDVIGRSVLSETISTITIGNGKRKILMWSQMHGNESTTTKAIFDLCNFFADYNHELIESILKTCTIVIIPMLNPDGAKAYTRLNANDVDLNRDAQELSQPESKILRALFDEFKPDFCFNLHGQRTIFSAGNNNFPATVSFLAPAQDESCSITENRKKAMEIISVMNDFLQKQIPNQVGIYDDTFNINCVGDTFQSQNVPTILIEAGHYSNDYGREETRRFIFQSLLTALHYIANTDIIGNSYKTYFDIPKNEKLFYDIIIRNANINSKVQDLAVMYQERLLKNKIEFIPIIEKINDLNGFYGHREINANNKELFIEGLKDISEGVEIDFVSINNENTILILKNN